MLQGNSSFTNIKATHQVNCFKILILKKDDTFVFIQGVRFVRDQTKSDDRLGQTKKKSPLLFCKIRNRTSCMCVLFLIYNIYLCVICYFSRIV